MNIEKNTLEFVAVSLEFCTLMETEGSHTLLSFTNRALKILPLLYLHAIFLPEPEERDEDDEPEFFITEETYEVVRGRIAELLGIHDMYLETFHPDMPYSDTPIAATISENLADVYQDIGNFVALFRQENEEVREQALYICKENFRLYWGQKALNALKALHDIRYNQNRTE